MRTQRIAKMERIQLLQLVRQPIALQPYLIHKNSVYGRSSTYADKGAVCQIKKTGVLTVGPLLGTKRRRAASILMVAGRRSHSRTRARVANGSQLMKKLLRAVSILMVAGRARH